MDGGSRGGGGRKAEGSRGCAAEVRREGRSRGGRDVLGGGWEEQRGRLGRCQKGVDSLKKRVGRAAWEGKRDESEGERGTRTSMEGYDGHQLGMGCIQIKKARGLDLEHPN